MICPTKFERYINNEEIHQKMKVSLRIENDLKDEIDSMIDHITIRNRSHAIKELIKKALDKDKIAVILSKGSDLKGQNLKKELIIDINEHNITAQIGNTTLIEEQIKQLKKYGFNTVYIISIPEAIERIKELLKNEKNISIRYVENKKSLKTTEALKLLKGKIHSNFLLFYGDIYFDNINLNEIYTQHNKNKPMVTMLLTSSKTPQHKGNVIVDGIKITEFVEKKNKIR